MNNHSAILVDDEIHLTEHLQARLLRLWPELSVLGTAVNGRQALALINEVHPDIVFLDIQMPGISGLEVAAQLCQRANRPHIVFVTAYEQYAVQAFEKAAVDYLLKPIEEQRLAATVKRLQGLGHNRPESLLLSELVQSLRATQSEYLEWLRVGLDEVTELVPVQAVVYFQADQKYTSVFTETAEHLMRISIKDLEARLNPEQFWRIHRGTIVRVDQIKTATRGLRGRYTLKLRQRPETLRSSQAYAHLFKQM